MGFDWVPFVGVFAVSCFAAGGFVFARAGVLGCSFELAGFPDGATFTPCGPGDAPVVDPLGGPILAAGAPSALGAGPGVPGVGVNLGGCASSLDNSSPKELDSESESDSLDILRRGAF